MLRFICVLVILLALAATACSDSATGCESDAECRYGRICAESVCIEPDQAPGVDVPVGPFAQVLVGAVDRPLGDYRRCECEHNEAFRILLFLHPDGRVQAFYEEGGLGHGFNPSSESPFNDGGDTRVMLQATWSVDGDTLFVGDWMTCRYAESGRYDRPSIQCVLDDDVQSVSSGTEVEFQPGGGLSELPNDPSDPAYDAYQPLD